MDSQDQILQLVNDVADLKDQLQGLNQSSSMSRDTETAFRQRLGISDINKALTTLESVSFGGTGIDGDLVITSGTTTLDLNNASIFVKNYSSISITGTTAKLAFSNPNANGTIVILKSTGNVTITSSNSPAIDLTSLGGVAGSGISSSAGQAGNPGIGTLITTGPGAAGYLGNGAGQPTVAGGKAPFSSGLVYGTFYKNIFISCGAGGGSGGAGLGGSGGSAFSAGGSGGASMFNDGSLGGAASSGTAPSPNGNSGSGGRGGGGLLIECGMALNITGIINAAGQNASSPSGTGANSGGGGGGGGTIIIIYNTLTANSGTYTVNGGTGSVGVNSGATGGAGGNGSSLVAKFN